MSKADRACTTRRSLMAHSVAAAAIMTATASLALALPPEAPDHPDADLIRLRAELEAAWADERAIQAAYAGRWTVENEHVFGEACGRSSAVAQRILSQRARTLEGFRAKAQAVSWCYDGAPVEMVGAGTATSEHLMASIVNDLLAVELGTPA